MTEEAEKKKEEAAPDVKPEKKPEAKTPAVPDQPSVRKVEEQVPAPSEKREGKNKKEPIKPMPAGETRAKAKDQAPAK